MKKLLFTMLLIISANLYSQTDIKVSLQVANTFTGELIENGKCELLSPDSTFLANGKWNYSTMDGVRTGSSASAVVPCNGNYIFRLSHEDYDTLYFPLEVKVAKKAKHLRLGETAYMRKISTVNLDEFTVKATKIKMVVRGDTVVYNADAFQMSNGSMLDALIEQLPGVELKDNGVIMYNGKQIASLLVNGKDFFKGDPRVALDNLPAYMVNEVKVYERETDFEKLTGQQLDERPLDMDVRLKKEYSIGWIANAEAAYGTGNKYLGRVFALRFTDCSRLALFGNVNNNNDTRRPGRQGDWTPSSQPTGIQTSQTAGIEYLYENRRKTFEWVSNADFTHTSNDVDIRTNRTSFLSTGNTYARNENISTGKNMEINTKHSFKSNTNNILQNGNITFNLRNSDNKTSLREASYFNNPFDVVTGAVLLDSAFSATDNTLRRIVINRWKQTMMSESNHWNISIPYNFRMSPSRSRGISDYLTLSALFNVDETRNKSFDRYSLEYLTEGSNDYRNRYTNSPNKGYDYDLSARYLYPIIKDMNISLEYSYNQRYRSQNMALYRLDELEGWGAGCEYALGELPSVLPTPDINSGNMDSWNKMHTVTPRFFFRIRNAEGKNVFDFDLNVPVVMVNERLRFERQDILFDERRSAVLVSPRLSLQPVIYHKNGAFTNIKLNYDFSIIQPSMRHLVEVVSDANPLNVQMGNKTLENSNRHNVRLSMSTRSGKTRRQLYNLELNYTASNNDVGIQRSYNPTTGVYTTRPVNISGNWLAGGTFNINRIFGKNQNFTFDSNSSLNYHNSVDAAEVTTANDDAWQNVVESTVYNFNVGETLRLNWSRNGWHLGAKLQGNYTRATSSRENFNVINAVNHSYSASARIPLPWEFHFATDLTLYCRDGYNDEQLNTNELVWNARLERSILNGNLTFILDGFDILGNLSNVRHSINAQGITETYYNVVPAYGMLHIVYKLNIEPKKRK